MTLSEANTLLAIVESSLDEMEALGVEQDPDEVQEAQAHLDTLIELLS
jgi:hypothetical protein